jgi:hypothetical protein
MRIPYLGTWCINDCRIVRANIAELMAADAELNCLIAEYATAVTAHRWNASALCSPIRFPETTICRRGLPHNRLAKMVALCLCGGGTGVAVLGAKDGNMIVARNIE